MWIRIRNTEIRNYFNQTCSNITPQSLLEKVQLFSFNSRKHFACTLTRTMKRIGLALWIRIRIEVKSLIRIRTETNADPLH
jgi:hypothetical protein